MVRNQLPAQVVNGCFAKEKEERNKTVKEIKIDWEQSSEWWKRFVVAIFGVLLFQGLSRERQIEFASISKDRSFEKINHTSPRRSKWPIRNFLVALLKISATFLQNIATCCLSPLHYKLFPGSNFPDANGTHKRHTSTAVIIKPRLKFNLEFAFALKHRRRSRPLSNYNSILLIARRFRSKTGPTWSMI